MNAANDNRLITEQMHELSRELIQSSVAIEDRLQRLKTLSGELPWPIPEDQLRGLMMDLHSQCLLEINRSLIAANQLQNAVKGLRIR